jgi:predicted molibdopterin-dependent oxidoreductase YjgC
VGEGGFTVKPGGRITEGIRRGQPFEIDVDGKRISVYEGESIAAALLASGIHTLRHTAKSGAPRGMFCGMGVCFECAMIVNGVSNVRTCVTLVEPGMQVRTPQASHRSGVG